jgi:spore maturation protein CgeB
MKIAWFGSSLVSAYWNGAATYYRGLVRALAERGHAVVFLEPDAYGRQEHRDLEDPDWAEVVVYDPERWQEALRRANGADVVVKSSGVGVLDRELETAVLELEAPTTIFWDVDAPATLTRLESNLHDPLRALLPDYDLVLTYGGGDPVVERYLTLGARECAPVYNALDPATHHPVAAEERFRCDLAFLGNRLPDRERRVDEFFFRAAELAAGRSFLLGGSGWEDRRLPGNVRSLGHVPTRDHNALNATPLAVLNVSRESMASNGYSPATRVFEAAGAGACLITDAWEGIERFLEPDEEVLVAGDGAQVAELLVELDPERARAVGTAARLRVLAEHTYAHRAADVERLLARVGSTEPASRRRLDGAGQGAQVPASPAPERDTRGDAGSAGVGAGTRVGSTEPASRRRLDGAGQGAQVPASPAPERDSGDAGSAGVGAGTSA